MAFPFKWQTGLLYFSLALLAGCQTNHSSITSQKPIAQTAVEALSQATLLRQDGFEGVYEIALEPRSASLFVAATPIFEENASGRVYRLDARSLQLVQTIQLPHRAFALGLNQTTNTLFVGNTLDGSITLVDTLSGQVKNTIQLAQPEVGKEGKSTVAHTRKVVVDEAKNRLFVTSPGRQGLVWIVDVASGQVQHTIETQAPWTAGAVFDSEQNRLYVSQGGKDEILAIDPDTAQVVQRYSTGDTAGVSPADSKHFFVNMTLDLKGQRLMAVDANTGSVYVFDAQSGQQLKQLALSGKGALDIVFNSRRNEIIVSNRGVSMGSSQGVGAITIFDARSYELKRSISLGVHPNSLALSADEQTLYVSVKTPHAREHEAWRQNNTDSIVRIDL